MDGHMNWRQLAVLHFVLPILFNTTYIYYTHTNMTLRGARWREWKRGKRDNNACAIFCHSEDNFFARAKDASSTKNIKNCTRSTLTANWKQYQAMVDKISKTLLTVSLTDSPIWIQEMLSTSKNTSYTSIVSIVGKRADAVCAIFHSVWLR